MRRKREGMSEAQWKLNMVAVNRIDDRLSDRNAI